MNSRVRATKAASQAAERPADGAFAETPESAALARRLSRALSCRKASEWTIGLTLFEAMRLLGSHALGPWLSSHRVAMGHMQCVRRVSLGRFLDAVIGTTLLPNGSVTRTAIRSLVADHVDLTAGYVLGSRDLQELPRVFAATEVVRRIRHGERIRRADAFELTGKTAPARRRTPAEHPADLDAAVPVINEIRAIPLPPKWHRVRLYLLHHSFQLVSDILRGNTREAFAMLTHMLCADMIPVLKALAATAASGESTQTLAPLEVFLTTEKLRPLARDLFNPDMSIEQLLSLHGDTLFPPRDSGPGQPWAEP